MIDNERGRGSPSPDPTFENQAHSQDHSPNKRSHESLVQGFRAYIHEQEQFHKGAFSPADIISLRLNTEESESLNLIARIPSIEEEENNFFWQLRSAWDVLAYNKFEPGSSRENTAGVMLWDYYRRSHKPSIKLTHPTQVQIIDALTEAVGIPHEKGKSEIPIPEKLRDYIGWSMSKEYRELVAKAKSKRNK